jgi:hypothetical protein
MSFVHPNMRLGTRPIQVWQFQLRQVLSISAPLYRRAEYIRVVPVVIAELEFSDVQMQIFLADLMECPDDSALEDGPEAFNCIGVNCANDMLANGVIDRLMREAALQTAIAGVSISAEQANASRRFLARKLRA